MRSLLRQGARRRNYVHQRRRNIVIPVQASHFLNQIDGPGNISPTARHVHQQAVPFQWLDNKGQSVENSFDLLYRKRSTQISVNPAGRDLELNRLMLLRYRFDDSVSDNASAQFSDQSDRTVQGRNDRLGIHFLLEAQRSF